MAPRSGGPFGEQTNIYDTKAAIRNETGLAGSFVIHLGEIPMTLPPLGPVSNDGRDPSRAPQVPYYSLWSAPNGTSGLANCALDGFAMKSVGGQAAPMWMRQIPGEVVAVFFTVLPVGWVGEWHESPKPQWVVPLSGHWFIETQDGSRVEMGAGYRHPRRRGWSGTPLRAGGCRTLRAASGPVQDAARCRHVLSLQLSLMWGQDMREATRVARESPAG